MYMKLVDRLDLELKTSNVRSWHDLTVQTGVNEWQVLAGSAQEATVETDATRPVTTGHLRASQQTSCH
jgi:hypothetical protein